MKFVGNQARRAAFIPKCFGIFTLFLLAGYALFGKGFAYLGVPPAFVGELGLLLAVAALLAGIYRPLLLSPVTWLLVIFVLWGASCTLPYVSEYGFDALRDGAIWGYAIYSLAVASVVLSLNAIDKTVFWYRRALPWMFIFLLIGQFMQMFANDFIPRWPWGPEGGVRIIAVKVGDLSVHLSGIFAFVMLGVSTTPFQQAWLFLWAVLAISPALMGRGSMMTIASIICLTALLRPSRKYLLIVLFLGSCLGLIYASGFEFDPGLHQGRVISVEQLLSNIESIISPEGSGELSGTKRWRELWWQTIFDYTFHGEYFWTGKGFGINLADADGFQVLADRSLRNPHSVHMTILGRAGVPGLVLWVTLQATFALVLFSKFLRDKRANRVGLARTEAWILLYWMAFLINASFDVALEGPQGGIWFWCVFGFGMALIVARRDKTPVHYDSP